MRSAASWLGRRSTCAGTGSAFGVWAAALAGMCRQAGGAGRHPQHLDGSARVCAALAFPVRAAHVDIQEARASAAARCRSSALAWARRPGGVEGPRCRGGRGKQVPEEGHARPAAARRASSALVGTFRKRRALRANRAPGSDICGCKDWQPTARGVAARAANRPRFGWSGPLAGVPPRRARPRQWLQLLRPHRPSRLPPLAEAPRPTSRWPCVVGHSTSASSGLGRPA